MPVPSKVAFVKYKHKRDAAVSLHLTNSILVDKCIQVVPWRNGKKLVQKWYETECLDEMPSEAVALQQLFPGKGYGQNAQNKPTLEILLKKEGFEAAPVSSFIRPSLQRFFRLFRHQLTSKFENRFKGRSMFAGLIPQRPPTKAYSCFLKSVAKSSTVLSLEKVILLKNAT